MQLEDNTVVYEFPGNEKTRACLRLEHCFAAMRYFLEKDSDATAAATFDTLFDLINLTMRPDLKKDLIQDLQRTRIILTSPTCPDTIPVEEREGFAEEIRQTVKSLVSPAPGTHTPQSLRENDWLGLVRTRSGVPGGCCSFDMPSLHYWLSRPFERRHSDMQRWVAGTRSIEDAVALYLRLLRRTEQISSCRAQKGLLSQSVSNGKCWSLIRIGLPADQAIIPDVNINKFILWIHFNDVTEGMRTPPSRANVEFTLGLCAI